MSEVIKRLQQEHAKRIGGHLDVMSIWTDKPSRGECDLPYATERIADEVRQAQEYIDRASRSPQVELIQQVAARH